MDTVLLNNLRVNTHKIINFYDKFYTLQNLSIYVIKFTSQNQSKYYQGDFGNSYRY